MLPKGMRPLVSIPPVEGVCLVDVAAVGVVHAAAAAVVGSAWCRRWCQCLPISSPVVPL